MQVLLWACAWDTKLPTIQLKINIYLIFKYLKYEECFININIYINYSYNKELYTDQRRLFSGVGSYFIKVIQVCVHFSLLQRLIHVLCRETSCFLAFGLRSSIERPLDTVYILCYILYFKKSNSWFLFEEWLEGGRF